MVKQWYCQNVQHVSKKSRFIKNEEAKGLLSNLYLRAPLNRVPIVGGILFWEYKMNEIVNKFLLAGDKFVPEMHLKQPGFTYSACGPFAKNKERIQKLKKKTEDTNYIYKTEFNKACFQHDMAHEDLKNLARRTAFDKVLRDRAFNIAKNPKYDGCRRQLASWFTSVIYKFFDKKSIGSGVNMHVNNERPLNFAEELHKPIIRKF